MRRWCGFILWKAYLRKGYVLKDSVCEDMCVYIMGECMDGVRYDDTLLWKLWWESMAWHRTVYKIEESKLRLCTIMSILDALVS